MSLKIAAEHLKTKGRNDDTELVHMTKDEVRGLQTMAKAHGGSLTVNPETGLPEAGFLSGILPMIAGAAAIALAPETGGMSLEAYSALAAGGIGLADYALTGSLKQGIMAGIGAYGGAGLASSLGNLGAEAAVTEGGDLAVKGAQDTLKSAIPTETGSISANTYQPIGEELGKNVGQMSNLSAAQQEAIQQQLAQQTTDAGREAVLRSAGQANAALAPGAGAPSLSNMGAGLKAAAGAPGSFIANNVGNIGMAAAPMLTSGAFAAPQNPQLAASQQKNPFGLKTLSSDFQGSFPTQPNPHYQAQYTDYTKNPYNPGIRAMAVGGIAQDPNQVQTQDKNFTAGGMYPMSQQDHTQYATAPQTPISMQATLAGYDPETNPLTGEPTTHMASGGIASYSGKSGSLVDALNSYNSATNKGITDLPRTSGADAGIYTDTDPNTRNLDAYSASLYGLKKAFKKAGIKDGVKLADAKPLSDIEADAAGGLMAGHGGGLGSYSDGGHLLKGPGDGMSDSIPAQIGKHQPARLADGEFVVPADVVSHLGNGSTEAGAKQLYAMMDKIRRARTGKKKQAPEVKPEKYLPK